jgi:hypothetical protein
MKLKLIKPYSMFPAGQIVDFGRGVAELLIQRKVAEPLNEEKKKTPLRVTLAKEKDAV